MVACSSAGSSGGGSSQTLGGSASGGTTTQFTGTWLCNLTLVEDPGGTGIYPPTLIKTVLTGRSLSIFAQESDSVPQSWFCGFNYVVQGLTASLAEPVSCTSYDTVQLASATVSVTADGNELSLQESGVESGFGSTERSTISGVCSRN